MTTEQKFYAAVDVVNSLPRNGPFQPSQDLMLKFYSYHKQATEGPCNTLKPSFWDANKYKWTVWKSLGQMSKETAMKKYVEELVKIIETMSYNETVSSFMDVMGPIYEIVWQDEDDVQHLDRDKSTNSDGYTKENDFMCNKERTFPQDVKENENYAYNCSEQAKNFLLKCPNVREDSINVDDMEFHHTENWQNNASLFENQNSKSVDVFTEHNYSSFKRKAMDIPSDNAFQFCRSVTVSNTPHVFVNNMLSSSVIHLQQSLEAVVRHLDTLEVLIKSYKMQNLKVVQDTQKTPSCGLPPWAAAFAFLWPFFVHWLLYIVRKYRNKFTRKLLI